MNNRIISGIITAVIMAVVVAVLLAFGYDPPDPPCQYDNGRADGPCTKA